MFLNEEKTNLEIGKPLAEMKVVVAMSGGVDSSVVAAMLKQQGCDVIGITLQLYDHGATTHRAGSCCAGQDIHDAKRVAHDLGISHYVLDYERQFHDQVIESFASSYMRGETPVPCIACNQYIKFADLLETAQDLGADFLATGHYIDSRPVPEGGFGLFRAFDSDRDQSYFLFATTKAQLEFLRFPLGSVSKGEVRNLAQSYGLSVAAKRDSQDICFVPSGKYGSMIERLHPEALCSGEIVHIDGRVLGRHPGIIHYTIGQRKGLGLADIKAGGGAPLYVVSLDATNARVTVGPREALETKKLFLREVNWMWSVPLKEIPDGGMEIFVRVRSTSQPVAASVCVENERVVVELANAEEGVSPGQACVFYESGESGARLLGGGIIDAVQIWHVSSCHSFPSAFIKVGDRA